MDSSGTTSKRKAESMTCDWVTLDANVGSGSQGTVSKVARRDNINDVFALKSFKTPDCRQHEESVLKEVNSDGGHAHIARPVSYIANGGIVFPLYTGGDLFDYVTKSGPFSEHEAATLMLKISSAVAHLHRNNIAHMDIKLENMLIRLIDSKKEPILCDFGLADHIPPDGMGSKRSGSRDYSAPELSFVGCKFLSRAADVWSLGICAFALCMARLPAARANILEVCAKVKDGSILVSPYQRTCTSDFLAVVDRCLQIKPEKRPSADEICRLWEQFLDPTSQPVKDSTYHPIGENDTSDPDAGPTPNLNKEDDTFATVKEDDTAATVKQDDTSAADAHPKPI